jgi:hypothetical protein
MSFRVEVNLHIDAMLADLEKAQPDALAKAAEVIRANAVANTPYETGRLAGSAAVTVDGDEATISYDGPYARYQHERLDLRHETGRAKYLELAVIEEKENAVKVLGQELRRATS